MENQQIKTKWYYNKIVVNLVLILFSPIGLFLLWKSERIAKWWKITATSIIGTLFLFNLINEMDYDTSYEGRINSISNQYCDCLRGTPSNYGQYQCYNTVKLKVGYLFDKIHFSETELKGSLNHYLDLRIRECEQKWVNNDL